MKTLQIYILFLLASLPGLAQDSAQAYMLRDAAAGGDLARVRSIVEGGVDVNLRLGGNSTALHMAAALGRLEVVEYLIGRGADPTIKDGFGRTAADLARSGNHTSTAQYLVGVKGQKTASTLPVSTTSSSSTHSPTSSRPTETRVVAPKPGIAAATPGLYRGRVTSRQVGSGETITFRVFPDGRVDEIVFEGYWYNHGSGATTEHVTTGPPDGMGYEIEGGRFGGERKAMTSGWQMDGRFDSASSASGTFRAYSSGIYNTPHLEWKATRVSN